MPGKLIRQKHITRDYVRLHRSSIFVFGDNMAEKGFGGQASQMRGEPNTIGIPTKWNPYTNEGSYFTDADLPQVRKFIDKEIEKLKDYRQNGFTIVIPSDGIGTGLAQLQARAPTILDYINKRLAELEN